jgi:tetratricopeptide (TPR) repeat protein
MNELVEIAIAAYRAGRYRDAIELLLQVTDHCAQHWLAHLYLGMCYEKCGRISDAHRLFKRLAEECADEHIRQKAGNALPLVEAEMRHRFKKQPPTKPAPNADLDEDVVWIANENY